MHSLNAHLRAGDSHDALPFHAACPICRDRRLQGDLAVPALVPMRAQAAVVAGAVALTSVGVPMTALAAEQDQTDEGTAQVTQTAPADPAVNADFDPGGGEASLPDQPAPAAVPAHSPAPEVADDNAPVAAATQTTETDDPVVDAGDDAAEPSRPARTPPAAVATPAPAVAAPVPVPVPVVEGPPVPLPVAAVPNLAPNVAVVPKPTVVTTSRKHAPMQTADKPRSIQVSRTPAPRAAAPPPVVVASATLPAATSQGAASVARVAVSSNDRTHVVRPGESLWAIAAVLVGDDASPAAIAREVNHLWSLNAERIGTGNPDLLDVGTRLRLR